MDTKKFKQKILDLAIHGKLVPQDPSDEPASVLLDRIRAEKERLIKEGKIKKSKKSSTSSDTSHYENDTIIPHNWAYTNLGNIFLHNTGKALNRSESNEGTELPYITTSNVYWNRFELSVVKRMYFKDSEIDKCTVKKGDLLVCEGGDIGRSAIWNDDTTICIQNHIHRLRPIYKASCRFYLYVLMYYKNMDMIDGKGIGMLGLSSGQLDKLVVPLPPHKEQERIADFIEQIFLLIDSIENQRETFSNLIKQTKSKILDLAIHGKLVPQDPNDEPASELLKRINPKANITTDNAHSKNLPEGWVDIEMKHLIKIVSGVSYKKEDITVSGIRILRGGNIQDGQILLCEDDVYIDKKYANEENSLHKNDIVLVASTGSSLLIGKTGFAQKTLIDTQIGAFLRILRPNIQETSKYINLIFSSDYYREYIRSLAKGTNINNVKSAHIENFIISFPPLAEQRRIVAKVEELFALLDRIESSLQA